MAQIVETVDVSVPVETSYNQWTHFDQFPQFLTFVKLITETDAKHSHWKVNIAGADREFDTVITEEVPDDRIAWTSTGGQVDHAGVVTFHKLSDYASRVAVQIDWDPEGVVEKAGAVLNIPDRAVGAELENFRKFVEAGNSTEGTTKAD